MKPAITTVAVSGTYARMHLSLDGETPLCGQQSSWPFKATAKRRPATCRNCRDVVQSLNRRLDNKLKGRWT